MHDGQEPARLWYRFRTERVSSPTGWRPLGVADFRESAELLNGGSWPRPIPHWAQDLARFARAAVAADKFVRRTDSHDGWRRSLSLRIPVESRDRWDDDAVAAAEELLAAMSGDVWSLRMDEAYGHQGALDLSNHVPSVSEVTLLSGGLDSLAWAVDRAARPGGPLLCVMHGQNGLESQQATVQAAVREVGSRSGRCVKHVRMFTQPRRSQSAVWRGDSGVVEDTSRLRGLAYLADAVRFAAADGVPTVYAPENGLFALNPPLTAARSSTLSTRSVHPWTLHLFNVLLNRLVGPGEAPIEIVNPLLYCTKGDVCAKSCGHLGKEVLWGTSSCGSLPRDATMLPANCRNCGVCYPCLGRRAGLLAALGGDATVYAGSPTWRPSPKGQEDWSDLQRWLARPFRQADLEAGYPLGGWVDRPGLLTTIERNREELRGLTAVLAA